MISVLLHWRGMRSVSVEQIMRFEIPSELATIEQFVIWLGWVGFGWVRFVFAKNVSSDMDAFMNEYARTKKRKRHSDDR